MSENIRLTAKDERLDTCSNQGHTNAVSGRAKPKPADGGGVAPLGNTQIMSPPPIEETFSRYARRRRSANFVIENLIAKETDIPAKHRETLDKSKGIYLDKRTGEVVETGWLKPPRIARCSWTIGKNVYIKNSISGAHYGNIERCSSISACPCCAPVIRAGRAREIEKAAKSHLESHGSGSLLFLTLTVRHDASMKFSKTLDTVAEGWRRLIKNKWWRKPKTGIKARFGIEGYIRALETTWGVENGWHPHAHILLFLEKPLPPQYLVNLGNMIHIKWAKWCKKELGLVPSRERGIDVQVVENDLKVLSKYLSKVDAESKRWGLGGEMARGDVKRGKKERFQPFQFLDDDMPLPRSKRFQLWNDYAEVMHGRRVITWSRGLKKRYEVEELDDEQILESGVAGEMMWSTAPENYERLRKEDPKFLVLALQYAQEENFDMLSALLPPSEDMKLDSFVDTTGEYAIHNQIYKEFFEHYEPRMHAKWLSDVLRNSKDYRIKPEARKKYRQEESEKRAIAKMKNQAYFIRKALCDEANK